MNRRIYGEESELGALVQKGKRWIGQGSFNDSPDKRIVAEVVASIEKTCWGFQENGGLIYYDRGAGHPEICTPETSLVRDLVLYSKVSEALAADLISHPKVRIILIKDNTNSRDSRTFGSHENYSTRLDSNIFVGKFHLFSRKFLANLALFLTSRIIITGGGILLNKLVLDGERSKGVFFLSNRARHVNWLEHNITNRNTRPIVNTRNESLSRHPWQRIHITCGDPNISEVAQYIRYGLTGLILRLGEEGRLPFSEFCTNPVGTMRAVSKDLSFDKQLIEFRSGKRIRALDVMQVFLNRIKEHYPASDDSSAVVREIKFIIAKTESILKRLEENPKSLEKELDWAFKKAFMEKYLSKAAGLNLSDLPQFYSRNSEKAQKLINMLKFIEQRYHELSPNSLWRKASELGRVERILSDGEINKAKYQPPGYNTPSNRTRSYARGLIVKKSKEMGSNFFPVAHNTYAGAPVEWDRVRVKKLNGVKEEILIDHPFEWDLARVNNFLES